MIKQTRAINLEELTSHSVLKIEKIDENQVLFIYKKKNYEYSFNIDYNPQKLFYGNQQSWAFNAKAPLNIKPVIFVLKAIKMKNG